MQVGVVSTGIYIPEHRMTSRELAKHSGIPQKIVEQKLGINQKPIPGPKDHTAEMGVWAAQQAFQACDVKPEDIDLVIYIGEEHKEYPLWTAGIFTQEKLGCMNAWAFDVQLRCGTAIMAMKVAKDMMIADSRINTVLLAGGYRNVDFIDYENPRTRFMYNLGAGGAAMILQRDYDRNQLLESTIITDGTFSEDVVVVGGGTKNPMSKEVLDNHLYQLDVLDPDGMKKRLEEKSMQNFIKVIRDAIHRSGYQDADINYVALLHMKRSAHEFVLNELGLSLGQSIYLEDYGHIGQMDQIISLELALEKGQLKDGDVVVFVSAGIGYAWGANVIRWGI
ncbi:3-oxoacyl-ACP synthase [Tenuibacillus multivorans]|uniref:3-oxoacyl-[acyl-carrier-protein] synthase-3 n=1 Tax=Tenuibacillus multivorans TaxID=237069 RepID=A0A1H0G234_9BACI|nr:3-oxoacyl-ACP synthase [Tenuibacillus multivorans]GEL78113.1 3-oxoacyl-[acyl-carrier-protein] synthase 3 [Tenuibacillus multivorans]SDO00922.1 3-oxoacyl-[acyl-carrier-protein] synthase-3 [Tenuibacillus multivorans]